MLKVVDAAVAKAYGGKRKIHWMEVYAGEKSTKVYGPDVWLHEETLEAVKDYVVSIKGPLTAPVGGGIRSLTVADRKSVVWGQVGSVRVDLGGRRIIKEKQREGEESEFNS